MQQTSRPFWIGIGLGITSLAASYTLTLFVYAGPEAFAAPASCPAAAKGIACDCTGKGEACDNAECAKECPNCARK